MFVPGVLPSSWHHNEVLETPESQHAGLSVRGLIRRFGGRIVLSEVDLRVAPGEIVALVGPNGVGKTTLLRAVLGDETGGPGEVLLDGEPLDERRPRVRRDVAAVLDDLGWFPDVTSAEHLDLLARARGDPAPQDRVDAALEALGIDHIADQVPATLSSGQRRRLALATTLVRSFTLLLLDEPEQRLDAAGHRWLARHLMQVAAGGAGVLMASHDESLRAAVGAREVLLEAPHE